MRDQPAADDLRDRRRHALHGAHGAECAASRIAVKQYAQRGHHLGHEDGRAQALADTHGDQHPRRGGQPAQRRCEREQRHACQKHALASEQIAQARAVEQEHRIRRAVADHHELDFGKTRMQAGPDVRNRHIDDEQVENGDEVAGQQRRQRGPVPFGWRGNATGGKGFR